MSASALSRCRSRNGLATACLIIAQLSPAACGRDPPRRDSISISTRSLFPSRAADTLLGADADRIYAAMDEQIGRLRERGLAAWALLDSLGSSSSSPPSSSLRRLPVVLARFPRRIPARGALDRATMEFSEGPVTIDWATVQSTEKVIAWDEGGKVGVLAEMRLTMAGVRNGAPLRIVQQYNERTEVKFCPDAQGMSPGTWKLDITMEVFAGGNEVERGEFRPTAELTGQVDDEAELTRLQEELEVKVRESSGSASRDLTPVFGSTTEGATGGSASIDSWEKGGWRYEAPSDGHRQQLERAAITVEGSPERTYRKARDRWRHGRCVEVAFLEGDKRRNVSPDDRVRIVAEARHKEDGSKLPAPLEASIVAYQSITPDRKRIPPPAEFTYQAPESGTKEAASMRETGTRVHVTSTSRRGIGESEIVYRLSAGPSYQVKMRVQQQAEKLGMTFDVTYQATLEPGPDGELQGSGSYSGKELRWMVACSDVDRDPNAEEHSVSGKLKATGSAVDMGGSTMLMFTLETLDFPPPLWWSGEVDEEIKGREQSPTWASPSRGRSPRKQ